MTRHDVPGTVYLLHFSGPYKHARHYTGWASDLGKRLAEHEQGRGARLTAVAKAAGITWTLARTWPGTRARERQLKNQGGASRHCPACKKESTDMTTTDHDLDRADPGVTGDPNWAAAWDSAVLRPDHDLNGDDLFWAEPPGDPEPPVSPGKLGFADASRRITALYASGADLEEIRAAHDDLAASLATDAQTGPGRAYAREYGDTGRSLIADLRQDAAVARGQLVPASSQPHRTPHPDPVLAARGWQADDGVYQRTGQAVADREAG